MSEIKVRTNLGNNTIVRLGDQNAIKVLSSVSTENMVDSLNDLSDVDITTSTVSGSILVLNAQTGIYEATNVLYGGTY
jgi:hypothetical protein